MNEITLRWIELLVIDVGAVTFGVLGYRLFVTGKGKFKGKSSVSMSSRLFRLVFSGSAPGLFFMLVAGFVLCISIFNGLHQVRKEVTSDFGMNEENSDANTLSMQTGVASAPVAQGAASPAPEQAAKTENRSGFSQTTVTVDTHYNDGNKPAVILPVPVQAVPSLFGGGHSE
jgi:hypothetical protein